MDKQEDQKKVGSGGNIFNRIMFRQAMEDVASDKEKVPWNTPIRSSDRRQLDASFEDVASRRVRNPFPDSEGYVKDHNSLLSLQPWIFKKDNFYRDDEMSSLNTEWSDQCSQGMNVSMDNSLSEISPRSVKIGFGHGTVRNSLKSKRNQRFSVKPLSSEENCLIPQLYKDGLAFEEYVFSSSSATQEPSFRPFVITDGHRIISKSSFESVPISFETGKQKQVDGITLGNMQNVAGVSPLPKRATPKRKSRDSPCRNLDTSNPERSVKLAHSKDLSDGLHIFSIGVSIGIIYTILFNRREVDRLNDMLKSTKNLVQDLQDELEMKESMTVKELHNEAHRNDQSDAITDTAEALAESTRNQIRTYHPTNQNDEDASQLLKFESMSNIEAELEAELERLELNINASSLDGQMSRLSELDPDLIVDVTHGELRADMFANEIGGDQDDRGSDNTSTSTNRDHSGNYAVSPHELSLRLHEVIKSRLEERIKDLEQALQQSQRQLQLMHIEGLHSHRAFSSSDMGSSSNQGSPTVLGMENNLDQTFCISLSGDALNAYNEAYEEFVRLADTEEDPPSTTNFSDNFGNNLHSSNQSFIWGMDGKRYFDKEQPPVEIFWSKGSDGHTDNHITSEDEYEDKEEKMLIQQILERTRQGSPLVLHAQRLLFSMDE